MGSSQSPSLWQYPEPLLRCRVSESIVEAHEVVGVLRVGENQSRAQLQGVSYPEGMDREQSPGPAPHLLMVLSQEARSGTYVRHGGTRRRSGVKWCILMPCRLTKSPSARV